MSQKTRLFFIWFLGLWGYCTAIAAGLLFVEPLPLWRKIGWVTFGLLSIFLLYKLLSRFERNYDMVKKSADNQREQIRQLMGIVGELEGNEFTRMLKRLGYTIDFNRQIITIKKDKKPTQIYQDLCSIFSHRTASGYDAPVKKIVKTTNLEVKKGWCFVKGSRRYIPGDTL